MKKTMLAIASLGLLGVLAGCGQAQLTTSKTNYQQNGMVAVVKGTAAKKATLTYQIDQAKAKKVTVKSGTYVIQVPATTQKQTVTIKAKTAQKTTTKKVTVAAGKTLGDYRTVVGTYNQALVGMALSKDDQAKAQSLQKQTQALKDGQATADQLPELQTTQQAVQAAMIKAQQTQAKQLLPTKVDDGVQQLLKTKNTTIRANVQDDQILGLTLIAPVKALENKAALKEFGISFTLLAKATGADATKVMHEFEQFTKKSQKDNQTTMKTIHSNGVNFNTGFSASDLYIYITK